MVRFIRLRPKPDPFVAAAGFYGSKSSRLVSRELRAASGTHFSDKLECQIAPSDMGAKSSETIALQTTFSKRAGRAGKVTARRIQAVRECRSFLGNINGQDDNLSLAAATATF